MHVLDAAFLAAKVFVKGSPCGASYRIRTRDIGTPFRRIAYRCKVPTQCLIRANLAFFANQALSYVSGSGHACLFNWHFAVAQRPRMRTCSNQPQLFQLGWTSP